MPREGGSYRVEKKGRAPVLKHRTKAVEMPRARPAEESDAAPPPADPAAGKEADTAAGGGKSPSGASTKPGRTAADKEA